MPATPQSLADILNPGGSLGQGMGPDIGGYAVNAEFFRRTNLNRDMVPVPWPVRPPWSARVMYAQSLYWRNMRAILAAPIRREHAIERMRTQARGINAQLLARIEALAARNPTAGSALGAGATAAASIGGPLLAVNPILGAVSAAVAFVAGTVLGFIQWEAIAVLRDWHTLMRELTPAERFFVLARMRWTVESIYARRGVPAPGATMFVHGSDVYDREIYPRRNGALANQGAGVAIDCCRNTLDTPGSAFPEPTSVADKRRMAVWAALVTTACGDHVGTWPERLTARDLVDAPCDRFNTFRDLRDHWGAPWLRSELRTLSDWPRRAIVWACYEPNHARLSPAQTQYLYGMGPQPIDSPSIPRDFPL